MKAGAGRFAVHQFPSRIPTVISSSRSLSLSHFHSRNSSTGFGFGASLPILTSHNSSRFSVLCSSNSSPKLSAATSTNRLESNCDGSTQFEDQWNAEVATPAPSPYIPAPKLSLSDQAFFLLAFITCTTCVAFISLVVAAVPTLYAISRAAISFSKLADTAREELPSTMAAVRLSGMEISDLTLELSELSEEIADGVSKSGEALQAAEAGVRQISFLARQKTLSIIEERASLPAFSLQPVISGAARKTSRFVDVARKTFMSIVSGESTSENKDCNTLDRIEI